jgi:hypothetical protein
VRPYDPSTRFLENLVPGAGFVVRRAAFLQTGGFRGDFAGCGGEDWDLWLQIVEKGWTPVWVQEAVYHYRRHAESFLVQSREEERVDTLLGLLKWHRDFIRESPGFRDFLRPVVLPALTRSLREGSLRRARKILGRLLRSCPEESLRLVASYYTDRLSARILRS